MNKTLKIAIVASRFNGEIVDKLIEGAEETLQNEGISKENIHLYRVPGALEIPVVCLHAAQSKQYAGIIALGAVVKGETYHFEYVAGPCCDGVMQVQLQTGVPMTNAVLTTVNREQALARAGGSVGNKGSEAASGLLEVINVLRHFSE